MVNACARRNLLTRVRVNGVTLTANEEIKNGLYRTHHSLLLKMKDWRPSIRGLCFEVLGEDRSQSLEVSFLKEEVFEALSSLCGDKALGPNGFTMTFWHFCLDFVKSKIIAFFREFFLHGTFQRSLNYTFLVLIPRKMGS